MCTLNATQPCVSDQRQLGKTRRLQATVRQDVAARCVGSSLHDNAFLIHAHIHIHIHLHIHIHIHILIHVHVQVYVHLAGSAGGLRQWRRLCGAQKALRHSGGAARGRGLPAEAGQRWGGAAERGLRRGFRAEGTGAASELCIGSRRVEVCGVVPCCSSPAVCQCHAFGSGWRLDESL